MENYTFYFDIQMFDNHLIINDQNNIILIDTGSPSTLHNAPFLDFCGMNFLVCRETY
jgi:hypothetical protein